MLSFFDFLKQISEYLSLYKRNLKYILSTAFIFSIIALVITFFSEIKYKAELRFVVRSEGSGYALNGVLGGLSNALGGSTIGSPLERTIEIVSSDRIIGSALLSQVEINGRFEILANSLIRLNGLRVLWKNDRDLQNVIFTPSDTSIIKMSFIKRKAIKKLEELLIPKTGRGIISKTFDKKSGVVTLSVTHSDEEFAIVLAKEVFSKLKDFYVEQITTSSTNNVIILQRKVDSIKNRLTEVQSLYARNTDQSFGLLFQEDKVELKKLAVSEQMLLAMYSEAQKNLETFKFVNDSAIPSLTVIDMPYSPLVKIQVNKILLATLGFVLGGFISLLCITFNYWFKIKLMQ